jgi:hypothetical protein
MFIGTSTAAVLLTAALAQLPAMVQHVKVEGTTKPESVSPGEIVTLSAEVTPDRNVRVFAPGAKHYTIAFLALSPSREYSFGLPSYPMPKRQKVPGAKKKIPVYDGKFTLEQRVMIGKNAKPGEILKISGMLTYQACDDREVFARSAIAVHWTVTVR